MSGTTIATSKVTAILLADGWHRIIQGSFSVAALRFGAEADPGVEAAKKGVPPLSSQRDLLELGDG